MLSCLVCVVLSCFVVSYVPSRAVVSRLISALLASSRPVTSCHVGSGLVCSLPHWLFGSWKGGGGGKGVFEGERELKPCLHGTN